MNVKISMFVTCIEVIIYLLLCMIVPLIKLFLTNLLQTRFNFLYLGLFVHVTENAEITYIYIYIYTYIHIYI